MVQGSTQAGPGARGTWWRRRRLRAAAALLVLLVLGGYAAVQFLSTRNAAACEVRGADGESLWITPEQAGNAATIAAAASARGLPERAVTIALATAMQESALKNIRHGDRDSVGLFQQRPSQGWGTVEQILDPVYSANEFYDKLEKVPGYSRLPLTVAAQEVQKSGFPQAYAKHEPDASKLASALTGRAAASLSCTVDDRAAQAADGSTGSGGSGGSGGSAAAAAGAGGRASDNSAELRELLVREFGEGVLPQGSGGEGTGAPEGDGKASGSAVSLSLEGRDGEDALRRGWELAQWAVAHSGDLELETVSFAGRTWSAARSGDGWSEAGDAGAAKGHGQVLITVAR
ncbi:hypothetical protein ACFW9F_14905 [Streptomyces sp. NPDC059506]|uniref:hypothetical protein n=1 Tax=Streptomyces TaxID=1883 RepID=UPI0015FD7536|nr:hypothetical protein [Streptomyces sp. SCUT-3]QMV21892.1 hypothetical protein GQS52_08960 [Streptomyces sp. SCUT-3]